MPEGESLPKSNKAADWNEYANKKEKEFMNYHSKTNIFGRLKNPNPLGDLHSRVLSDNALRARKKASELTRKESGKSGKMDEYRDGGRVKKTGNAKLHEGEKVIGTRKTKRKSTRSSGRR